MAKNISLISYAIIGIALMVFGFYSSTMMYAYAIDSYTFNMSYSDLRGGKYSPTENAWWFVSTNNNTALKLPNNTTNPTSYPVNTNFNCADPQNILPLEFAGGLYYAVWCDNGVVASNGLMIRDQSTNEEKDFESNIFNTEQGFSMAEWENGNKLYVVNHGSTSQQLAIFNLQAINSTTAPMLVEVKNLSAQCPVIFDMVVDNANARAFISCQRITSNVMTIAVFDLLGSVVSEYITLSGASATLNLDYNPVTEQVIATSYGNNDIFVVDIDSSSIVQQNLSFCSSGSPLSPTFNENTNQAYILCNVSATGANSVVLYDITGNNTVSSFTTPNSVSGVQGGTNNWALIDFYSDIGYLYGAFGHVQNAGSGAGVNTGVIVIYDDSEVPSGNDPNAEFCSLPENENILICRIESGGGLTGSSNLINQSSTNIVCQIGLFACTQDDDGNFQMDNPDIQTNGMGYLLTIVAMALMITFFFIASGGRLGDIPTFVWAIGALSVLGGVTAIGWLNPAFLVISVVAIIALAVAKAKGIFSGADFFRA